MGLSAVANRSQGCAILRFPQMFLYKSLVLQIGRIDIPGGKRCLPAVHFSCNKSGILTTKPTLFLRLGRSEKPEARADGEIDQSPGVADRTEIYIRPVTHN